MNLKEQGLLKGLRVRVGGRGHVTIEHVAPATKFARPVVYVAISDCGRAFRMGKTVRSLRAHWRATLGILEKPECVLTALEKSVSQKWLGLLTGSAFEVWYKQVQECDLARSAAELDAAFGGPTVQRSYVQTPGLSCDGAGLFV